MKKILQLSCSRSLMLRPGWLAAALFTMAITFTGCKRDFPSPCHDRSSFNRKSPDIIVHSGGSIQAAVDAAAPGATIFIEGGTYNEAIVVDKAGIQLIGSSCFTSEKVIIQNPGGADNGITVRDGGDGFVLKNVTVQNFEKNGVFLIHVDHFLLSHVVAINDKEYGLFPVFCRYGVVEYCSASGAADTGIYVGQSDSVSVQFNEAYGNVNGIEIENCHNIAVQKNHSFDNVDGILVVLLPALTVKTSANILVSDNKFENNNHFNFGDPEDGFEAFVPTGCGILLVGVDNVTIKNNKVSNNSFLGIATVSTLILGALIPGTPPDAFADIEPNPDGAKIINNLLVNNGTVQPDPASGLPPAVDLLWLADGTNNCWKNNQFTTSFSPIPFPVCN